MDELGQIWSDVSMTTWAGLPLHAIKHKKVLFGRVSILSD